MKVKLDFKRLVCGVGINDADYVVQKFEQYTSTSGEKKFRLAWMCPYYRRWKAMITRCYFITDQERRPTYKGCKVCPEWITFSNFKAWMETQDWEGKQLDKDLLFKGSEGKLYSPETCCFIPRLVNIFMTERTAKRGKYLIGVDYNKEHGMFRSRCKDPHTGKSIHLGYFESELDAHSAWLKKKLSFAKVLAEEFLDGMVALALILKYENYSGVANNVDIE